MGEGIKLELPEGLLEQQIGKGIRATIMAGAVQHIVKELTPDRLAEFATQVLEEGLKEINGYQLRKMVGEMAEPMMKEYCMRPDFIARVETAVKEGMEKFIKDLPNTTYEEFKSIVVGALVDRYKKNGRY